MRVGTDPHRLVIGARHRLSAGLAAGPGHRIQVSATSRSISARLDDDLSRRGRAAPPGTPGDWRARSSRGVYPAQVELGVSVHDQVVEPGGATQPLRQLAGYQLAPASMRNASA